MSDEPTKTADSAASTRAIRGSVDFLNLTGCRTFSVERVEHLLVARASYDDIPPACPNCHAPDITVDEDGAEDWLIWDAPQCGLYPTLIQLFVPALRCLVCGQKVKIEPPWLDHTSLNPDEVVAPGRPTRTSRLIDYFLERVTGLATFDQIARETCQSPDAIRLIFLKRFKAWDAQRPKDLPLSTGFDELKHRVDHEPRLITIIVDTGGPNGIVDILPDRTNLTIARRFLDAPNRKEVLDVTTDFCEPFRDIATKPIAGGGKKPPKRKGDAPASSDMLVFSVAEMAQLREIWSSPSNEYPPLLENAKPVAEHYHFAQELEDAFDKVRTAVKNEMLAHYRDLEIAKYTTGDIRTFGETEIIKRATARARQLANDRADELFDKRRTFNKHGRKLTDEDRVIVQSMLEEFPLLKAGYELKDAGLDILDQQKTPEEIDTALTKWAVMAIASAAGTYFKTVLNFIRKWRPELIRFAEKHLSNAKTESKVGFLKLRNRLGRGVLFETIRAIMIWADAHRRNYRWPRCCGDDRSMTARRFIEYLDSQQ